jgi:hypothetical protein
VCTPLKCADLGYNCGFAADGCGGLLDCRSTCPGSQFCGGGGYDVCGPANLVSCPGGGSTTLSGYVYDPADNLPVYNALVYVPVGTVQTPTTGVDPNNPSCGCSAPPAYTSAYTNISGAFTLINVPSGTTTVVVELGKWQRVFAQNIVACQANTAFNGFHASHLTLPSDHFQGHIPRFAVDTGAVSATECVLSKMGISTAEFMNPQIVNGVPTAAGRVHLYQGTVYHGGAIIDVNTPYEPALTETATVLNSYDTVLFPCQGLNGSYTAGNGWPNTLSNVLQYADFGGRIFAEHYHYDLIQGNGSFAQTAAWNGAPTNYGLYYSDPTYNVDIDQTFSTGSYLAQWLNLPTVYGGTLGVIPVGVIRTNLAAIVSPAQQWLHTETCTTGGAACSSGLQCCSGTCTANRCTNPAATYPPANVPIHYSFDTPFNESPSCGRVVYSDFHVESQPDLNDFTGYPFPSECPGGATGAMTTQEKLLEFMLLNLTSCVSPPSCTPLTCANFPGACGPQGDGCGGQTANCGTCTPPSTCGGGGIPSRCG